MTTSAMKKEKIQITLSYTYVTGACYIKVIF